MLQKLNGHLPPNVLAELPASIERYHINSALRLAHFLAQCHHESGGFKQTKENLNYSAEGLKKTFGNHFTDSLRLTYAHKPEKIANRVYANRLGNGNEASGDGFKFCGRGYIQLSFRYNYVRFGESIGIDLTANPELVATDYPLTSAAWFFDNNRLWKWCDVGSSDKAVLDVTKRVNGGDNGLAERIELFNHYYALLTH
jgi:putative chitinase